MRKTTVYLPDELKHQLTQLAAATGQSEAELIRQAVESLGRSADRPRPHGALFSSGDPSLAENMEAALADFGQR